MNVLKWGAGKANLMYEIRPGLEQAAFFGDEMTVYDHMDEYEAAEVQLRKMSIATIQLLERAAVREHGCDFCGVEATVPCCVSTSVRGRGSPMKGAHIARQFAALRAGWTVEDEILMYGDPVAEWTAVVGKRLKKATTTAAQFVDDNLDDLISGVKSVGDLSDLIGK